MNENNALTGQIKDEKAAHERANADLKAVGDQLKRLGVNVSDLNASVLDLKSLTK